MNGPRHASLCLIAYANSEGSGEAWDLSASMSQIPMPSEWLRMRI